MTFDELPIPNTATRKKHGSVGMFVGTERVKTTKQVTKAEKAKSHTDIDPGTDVTVKAVK